MFKPYGYMILLSIFQFLLCIITTRNLVLLEKNLEQISKMCTRYLLFFRNIQNQNKILLFPKSQPFEIRSVA